MAGGNRGAKEWNTGWAERTLWNSKPAWVDYSGLMPANLTTLAHFSVSSAMSLPKSAGKPGSTVPPESASHRLAAQPGRVAAPLTETHKQVVVALEVADVEAFVQAWPGLPGRPPCDRAALARAFVAKAVIGLPTTSMLIERLTVDKQLRRLCGWERPAELCSEATFSRAFAEFARSELPSRVHEALIKRTHEDRLVGHISRDATAIEAREKPVKTV